MVPPPPYIRGCGGYMKYMIPHSPSQQATSVRKVGTTQVLVSNQSSYEGVASHGRFTDGIFWHTTELIHMTLPKYSLLSDSRQQSMCLVPGSMPPCLISGVRFAASFLHPCTTQFRSQRPKPIALSTDFTHRRDSLGWA